MTTTSQRAHQVSTEDIDSVETSHASTEAQNWQIINADMQVVHRGTETQMREVWREIQRGLHGVAFNIGRGGSATLIEGISTRHGSRALLIDTYPLGPVWTDRGPVWRPHA